MDDLLSLLIVPQANGTLVPASLAASSEQTSFSPNGQGQHLEQRPSLTTSAAPGSLKRRLSGMSSPDATLDFVPSPSAQYAQDIPMLGSEAHASFQDYSNLQSLDDFVRENPFAPKGKRVPARAVPVNPEYSIKFNDLCVKHFIVPAFEYDMPHQQCETVSVQFGDRKVDAIGPFASKKHAKEKVCKLAWPQLLEMDEHLQNKRKRPEPPQSGSGGIASELLTAENFIGLLQEYTQANRQGSAVYEDSRTITTPIRFLCTVRIEDMLGMPLGSSTDFYQSKQEAKRAAAREAVLWLRSQGKMRPAPPSVNKRLKLDQPSAMELSHESTSLTQLVSDADLDPGAKTTSAARLHELAAVLGFRSPIYESHPSVPPPGKTLAAHEMSSAFVDMYVRFSDQDVQKESRLAGPLGKVEHVHGRKNAKEQCCREAVRILEEIQRERAQES
ncbi:hypothetical protein D0869_10192 [Hortaea werneckii]|uniref:DRBM domain-containing protein n=1 Tax=Hortaea werneckii TaxID=91943 RepID=A0A3M6Y4B7_HORWE|nr:hypothetical protein KC324_g9257 [Hortaea werneckii]KAI7579823.1 hypothetical protein KC316_g9279 [Hortaea werneckii]RMX77028.1 hypothetical protein D0869_10192 [Hortaea werneckii]RMX97656.1 hypothetical protein D0868_10522 [Hortaea werneckii]